MTEPEATYPADFPKITSSKLPGALFATFQAHCPICDWESSTQDPKELVVRSYYMHLDANPTTCGQAFQEASEAYEADSVPVEEP